MGSSIELEQKCSLHKYETKNAVRGNRNRSVVSNAGMVDEGIAMRSVLLVFGIFAITGLSMAQTPPEAKSVWKGDELKNSGIQTLKDLFEVHTGWYNATSDDATIQFSRNGLAGPGGAWWPVYLNGSRMDIGAWDTMSPHILPVTLSQIDSVVIIDSPGLYNGTFTEKGGIFLYSDSQQDGLQVESEIMMGNKSGDPGPFVYTEKATRNIERLGPIMHASISYAKSKFALEGSVKRFVHSVSDPLQFQRLTPFEFGEPFRHPKIESNSFYLSGRYNSDKLENQIQFGTTTATDFLFTSLYGIEIPVDRRWGFISLDGSGNLSDQLTLAYDLTHSSNDLNEYPNKENAWLQWQQQVTSGQVSAKHSFQKGYLVAGASVDYYRLVDEANGDESLSTNLARIFNQLEIQLSDRLRFISDLMAVKGDHGKAAPKIHGILKSRIHPDHILSLDLSYSQRFPGEDNSLWYWIAEKGFGDDTLAAFRPEKMPERINFMQAKLGWKADVTEDLTFNTGISLNKNSDEYLSQYNLDQLEGDIYTGSYNFIPDLDATFLAIPLWINLEYSRRLRQTFRYTWRNQISGSTNFSAMAPNHRFNTYLRWNPVDSFGIWSRFHFQSASTWKSADLLDQKEVRINSEQTVTYSSAFTPRFKWDAGIRKGLWDEKIVFKLDALNIFDRKFRNHPVAPRHAFTLFLRIGFTVD